MLSTAVIGGGISGAACAKLLKDSGYQVTMFEQKSEVGGLVRCTVDNGNLFHRVGGHVFNSNNRAVSEWFWSHFDKEKEFNYAKRNAAIYLNDHFVSYPIEQNLYQLPTKMMQRVVGDLLELAPQRLDKANFVSFYDFLQSTFGPTLCDEYFIPYNTKIWNVDLGSMPISWLDGKLPMPTIEDIISSNISRESETRMVHANFYYPKNGGSQFLIERLLDGIEVRKGERCDSIRNEGKLIINGHSFDSVVYTGDIRELPDLLNSDAAVFGNVKSLKCNGTTTVLCSCDVNPYSWLYIPNPSIKCHRMIMTGNFAESNNAENLPKSRTTCTVEFVGEVDRSTIEQALRLLPLNPSIIAVNFEPRSYVIQEDNTRAIVLSVRNHLKSSNIWICGRFAEWEYFNMDAAIASAMKVVNELKVINSLT